MPSPLIHTTLHRIHSCCAARGALSLLFIVDPHDRALTSYRMLDCWKPMTVAPGVFYWAPARGRHESALPLGAPPESAPPMQWTATQATCARPACTTAPSRCSSSWRALLPAVPGASSPAAACMCRHATSASPTLTILPWRTSQGASSCSRGPAPDTLSRHVPLLDACMLRPCLQCDLSSPQAASTCSRRPAPATLSRRISLA